MKRIELFENAMSYYGLSETLDNGYNPKILEIINNISLFNIKKSVPWCAAFVNHVLKENGFNYLNSLVARDILKLGRAVKSPKFGDIVVLWRGSINSSKGHVGFYVKTVGNVVYILGGNQDNIVCIKPYPLERVLSFRMIGKKK